MIHRDNRHGYESSSCFGQIIHRMKRSFTYTDVDGLVYNIAGKSSLLRPIEHKQPHQKLGGPQSWALGALDDCIRHYVESPPADWKLRLHPASGVYIVTGELGAATEGCQRTELLGPQAIRRLRSSAETVVLDESALYAWLDGNKDWLTS
jgi:hypothetical protein